MFWPHRQAYVMDRLFGCFVMLMARVTCWTVPAVCVYPNWKPGRPERSPLQRMWQARLFLAVAAVEKAEGEIRGATLPLWRVDLDDRWQSSVYVDPVTGRIVAARNTLWRIYDFFWMLHIMDYDTRDDFNNNLLRSASGVGWFIGLSGLWMLFYSFRRRDFVLLDKAVEKLRSRSKG